MEVLNQAVREYASRHSNSYGLALTPKNLTSYTPGRFQKRLRLIEARRLISDEGLTASRAGFEVGYESASQFTREYARLFGAPPKRDRLRATGWCY